METRTCAVGHYSLCFLLSRLCLGPNQNGLQKLGVQDALRANYLFIDTLSPTLMKRHARALARMPPGSIVMLSSRTTEPYTPPLRAVEKIRIGASRVYSRGIRR